MRRWNAYRDIRLLYYKKNEIALISLFVYLIIDSPNYAVLIIRLSQRRLHNSNR